MTIKSALTSNLISNCQLRKKKKEGGKKKDRKKRKKKLKRQPPILSVSDMFLDHHI